MSMQIRMVTNKFLAAERERSAHQSSKLVDGRNIGLLDGTKPGRKTLLSSKPQWSECVSYKLDEDGNKINARVFRSASTRKPNRRGLTEAESVELADKLLERKQVTVSDLRPLFAD